MACQQRTHDSATRSALLTLGKGFFLPTAEQLQTPGNLISWLISEPVAGRKWPWAWPSAICFRLGSESWAAWQKACAWTYRSLRHTRALALSTCALQLPTEPHVVECPREAVARGRAQEGPGLLPRTRSGPEGLAGQHWPLQLLGRLSRPAALGRGGCGDRAAGKSLVSHGSVPCP